MNQEMLKAIKDFVIEEINPDFIVLFGSQVSGQTHQNSDIDIAFYKDNHNISAYDIFMLAQDLADILKIEVDLIDLSSASTVFKAVIFDSGEIIYCQNENILDEYRMRTFSMYVRLNAERKEILDAIYESGRVYGY